MQDTAPDSLSWHRCPNCKDRIFERISKDWMHFIGDYNPQIISAFDYPLYKCADCQAVLSTSNVPRQKHCKCGSPLATMKLVVEEYCTCQKCSHQFDVSLLKSQAKFHIPQNFVVWTAWPATVRCAFNYSDWIGTKKLYVNLLAETPSLSLEIADRIVGNPSEYVSAFCPLCWFLRDKMQPLSIECQLLNDDINRDSDGFGGGIGESFQFICRCPQCETQMAFGKRYYSADYGLEDFLRSACLRGEKKKVAKQGVKVSFVGAVDKSGKSLPAKKKGWWPF